MEAGLAGRQVHVQYPFVPGHLARVNLPTEYDPESVSVLDQNFAEISHGILLAVVSHIPVRTQPLDSAVVLLSPG